MYKMKIWGEHLLSRLPNVCWTRKQYRQAIRTIVKSNNSLITAAQTMQTANAQQYDLLQECWELIEMLRKELRILEKQDDGT